MNNILLYEDFLKESYPRAYHDPIYGSDVFRIRYRANSDLSNKRAEDAVKKPINDLLDSYGIGDIVRGKSVEDGSFYTGSVIGIEKDEKGENISIYIEHDGTKLELAPATVTFAQDGDRGNTKATTNAGPDEDQLDRGHHDTFAPSTYESKKNTSR
jgi:hypothetical protein